MKNLFLVIAGMMLGIGLCDLIPQEIVVSVVFAAGVLVLFASIVCKIVDSIREHRRKRHEFTQRLASAEQLLFGKVINIDDIRKWRKEAKPKETKSREVDVPDFMKDMSEKERKYMLAQQRMDEKRKKAPPLKNKKRKSTKPVEQVSLKERAGGIRRAS